MATWPERPRNSYAMSTSRPNSPRLTRPTSPRLGRRQSPPRMPTAQKAPDSHMPMSRSSSLGRLTGDNSSSMGKLTGNSGNVSLCVRLRPAGGEQVCLEVKNSGTVSLSPQSPELGESLYSCDHTFGPEATQEQVYKQAVYSICQGVLRGYNGAVIAYGQTGSGKTHTMIGSREDGRGVAPQAVSDIFSALSERHGWTVEVSVLEIYNEKVRDLLAPSVTVVDIHEVCNHSTGISFHCPDATCRKVVAPEEALMALSEGMRRRETARTDMNHNSSRSHLVFTLTIVQTDPDVGATLRGRLHIVDLAGSERLKRSMASEYNGSSTPSRPALRSPRDSPSPRDMQRREAGEINKSLSQLALVIQRLTGPKSGGLHLVPYRDSMLTRLLAESFGGSSKTCLIITCSPSVRDREETRCSLEFGKRAKLVENNAEINLEVEQEITPIMQALIQREVAELHREKEEMQKKQEIFAQERKDLRSQLAEAQQDRTDLRSQLAEVQRLLLKEIADASKRDERHMSELKYLEEENEAMRSRLEESVRQTLAAVLHESRQLDDSRRERAAAREAERYQLAEDWTTKLRSPSIAHLLGNDNGQSPVCSTDCSTADPSTEDSSDA